MCIRDSNETSSSSSSSSSAAAAAGSSSSSCLPEFSRIGAWPSCYRFSTFNSSWHEAREYCSAFGANLLALDALKEAHIIDYLLNSRPGHSVKLEFHGTDTDTDIDTDILADFRARILARKSACPATFPFSLPRAGHARRADLSADLSDTRAFPR